MDVKPYITHAEAKEALWSDAETRTGIDRKILHRCYMDSWCGGVQLKDFIDGIAKGEIDREEVMAFENVEDPVNRLRGSPALAENLELMHRLRYDLKKTIQVGDELRVDKDEVGFRSEKLLLKGGKRYKIISLRDDGDVSFTAEHESELPNHTNYHGEHALWALWRDGVKIWDWHLTYYRLSLELRPDMSEADRLRMKEKCEQQAAENP